jgi:hypothetical protein
MSAPENSAERKRPAVLAPERVKELLAVLKSNFDSAVERSQSQILWARCFNTARAMQFRMWELEAAVAAEREACAKIAETHMIERWGHVVGSNGAAVGIEIAKIIRARAALDDDIFERLGSVAARVVSKIEDDG